MADWNVSTVMDPARLLLIDAYGTMPDRLGAALAADFAAPPAVVGLTSGRSALELLKSSPFDGLVADLAALADVADHPEECVARLARAASGALIVILVDEASISVAMAAMRAGAHDCVARTTEASALVGLIGELAKRHGKSRICLRRMSAVPEISAGTATPSIPVMRDLVLPMWRQEQRIIEDAIQSFAGNIALAAQALELSPSTIYRKRQAWAEMDGKRV